MAILIDRNPIRIDHWLESFAAENVVFIPIAGGVVVDAHAFRMLLSAVTYNSMSPTLDVY